MQASSATMRMLVKLLPLVLLACRPACPAAPTDVTQQALATLSTGGAAWQGRLTRSLRGAGFHRELAYHLRLQPCSSRGAAGLWRQLVSALRLPRWAGGCGSALDAETQCEIALVQPLPAGLYADMDQLGNLAAARRGTPRAFTARLFGEPDAERTEAESRPTALRLRWPARVQQHQPPNATAWRARSITDPQPAAGSAAGSAQSATAAGIAAEAVLPLHARYPAPVLADSSSGSDDGGGAWWQINWWRSPVVAAVLPQPLVRARCTSRAPGLQTEWHDVQLAGGGAAEEQLTWSIPAGHLRHVAFVNVVTAAAYAVGVAAVLKVVVVIRK